MRKKQKEYSAIQWRTHIIDMTWMIQNGTYSQITGKQWRRRYPTWSYPDTILPRSPPISLCQSFVPILRFLCALVLKVVSCELLHLIVLELLEPLHHLESKTCLRLSVPTGPLDAAC